MQIAAFVHRKQTLAPQTVFFQNVGMFILDRAIEGDSSAKHEDRILSSVIRSSDPCLRDYRLC